MNLFQKLQERSGNICELCASKKELSIYEVPSITTGGGGVDVSLFACAVCIEQINDMLKTNTKHWRCLNVSMWSEYRAVKIVSWRMLNRLKNEQSSNNLLDMLYLDDEDLSFAKKTNEHLCESEKIIHRDINGVILNYGDSVVLIKDLKVQVWY